jgi:hypothetical protein
MNFNNFRISKVVHGLIIVALLMMPFSFVMQGRVEPHVKKAEAQWIVEDFVNLVYNTFSAIQSGIIAAFEYDSWFKEYILDPLAWAAMKTIIRRITADIVTYIQNGFEVQGQAGNAGFLQDPGQFFKNIADETAGSFIFNELGPLGKFLCSPFDLKIRLSLQLNYGSSRYTDKAKCTLTQIGNNVSDSVNNFFKGDFNSGGWNRWFEVTQNPNNNAWGAYIQAEEELNTRIGGAQAQQKAELDWGSGFLSFKKCSAQDEEGKCVKYYNATPGALIEDQLATSFGSPIRQLELADEIDEILGALGTALLDQIFKTGGSGLSDLNQSVIDGFSGEDITGQFGNHQPTDPTKPPSACKPGDSLNLALKKGDGTLQMNSGDDDDAGSAVVVDNILPTGGNNTSGISIVKGINPWWQVDIGKARDITKIVVHRRPGPGSNEVLTNVSIFVSEAPFSPTDDPEVLKTKPGVKSFNYATEPSVPITINDVGVKGRYVRVQRSTAGSSEYLQLIEVQIFGPADAVDCPPQDGGPGGPGPNPIPGNLPPLPSPSPIPADACQINPGDNLQDKIDDCQGGTVVFNAGTYNIGSKLNLHSNSTYLGRNIDQVIFNSTSGYSMETRGKVGVRIEGMTFKGARGINIEGGERITVYRNIFTNITGNNAVRIATYLKNSQITDNRIVSSPGITGIESTRPTTFEFVRLNKNVCFNVWECIHVFGWDYQNLPPRSHDVEINDNFVRGAHRHALEIQDSWDRLEIARNDIDDFTPNANSGNNCPTGGFMGISQATGGSINVKVHDNKVSGDGRGNSGPSCFSAHEIISETTEVYNNIYSNWGWGMLTSYKPGNWNAHDNKYCNITNKNGVPSGNGNTYQAGSCL